MHMADALVAPAVATTMYAATSVTAAISVKKVKLENDKKIVPFMGVMSAFVFAAQMVNITIPGTGSSGHFCGGLLLAILVGPYAGFLAMISVLAVQCLLFADGGILALGANIWNMAFYSCFIGYLCIYRPLMKKSMSTGKILITSVLASVVSLQLGAFSVTLQTLISGVTSLSFGQFLLFMQPIHLAIGVLEGLITGAVIIFVFHARPELLHNSNAVNKIGLKQVLIILSTVVIFLGGGLSLLASENPDGLEWSIQNLTGSTDVEPESKYIDAMDNAAKIQEKTALLPDYSFKDSESKLGTSFSGVFGAIVVGAISLGCCVLLKTFKRKDDILE
ncbi:energy-coupling factor ABC transporter permease [Lachnoclostridium phytofermentans]|uniref:Cobalamin (Vitamin B12) biosynthesis CbiM protein n=1 Tax=Lachnoclostridium phytofermentans (strain ATCC 700394 / DSM 18823 / ISDg) TaxID=357809 RepID=A9KJR3_LACP7|nr:energy-coupling factor ABC transporter permease [Lachnoclostridium phytofermentans]ABX41068.1 cobalamin (vitamin B12) biosynthesis CbiM protein [Lachnoclostridium phytofermentans ISDg]